LAGAAIMLGLCWAITLLLPADRAACVEAR
jgi:hypothetical protein